ncbi:MAG: YlxR family protein [Propionibacterium sp.]|nr:YlxR family protein [Propionibacterium sp.]
MPRRTCIGCRRTDEQSSLIRLVRRGGTVVDGTRPRAEGRGAYLHPGCVVMAVERRAIGRAFPGATVDAELLRLLDPESVPE